MSQKLLLIGIDAMSPLIVERLMKRGLLPNFAKLNFSPLGTTTPPETPVAWSAAATGCNPGKFGIYDFIDRNPSTYLPKLCLTEEKPGLIKTEYKSAMKGTPFWRRLNQQGIETSVIRWPVTFPAAELKGRLMAGLGAVDLCGSLNSYRFYTDDRAELEKKGSEKVIVIDSAQQVTTRIPGPVVRKRGKLVPIDAALKVERHADRVRLTTAQSNVEIKQGEWSPFFRISFEVLPFHFMHGICNAFLCSASPTLRLYLSSVQIDPSNQAFPLTYPAEYGREIEEHTGLFHTLGMPEETKAVTEDKLPLSAFLQQIDQIELQREAHFRFELKRFRNGVLAFIFDAGDRLQHLTWEELKEDSQDVPEPIERYYIAKDRLMGEVLSAVDSNTKLIVMSDHGFSHFRRQVNVNRWLLEQGFLSSNGQQEAELFRGVDWARTKAYAVGFTSLFLNLKGREGSGSVDPSEREELLKDISGELLKLKDGGIPVLRSVARGSAIYSGEFAHEAPDLVLGFSPGYRMSWQSAVGLLAGEVVSDNDSAWKADHLIDNRYVPGVLFTNFKIGKSNPQITDIAPTILDFFGLDVPAELDGEVLL